jgi:hypothetical protein
LYDLERPFHRLIHHFVTRIFHGAGDGDDLQFSIPALLGLLSTPSAFGAILLVEKYSSLRLFLMGITEFNTYRTAIADEYFFIVYSMVVTGAVVILKWDRLFPDRQDYDNLAALPISTRQTFLASLTALLFLASLFAVIINGPASLIFPYAVTARYNSVPLTIEFIAAHALAVILASVFACFGLLLVMAVTILVTPKPLFRTVSLAVRILGSFGLVAILASEFTLPRQLLSSAIPSYARYVPSVWFLDLQQTVLSRGTPLTGTGLFGLQITIAVFVLAMAAYAAAYYREYVRIPEQTGVLRFRGRDSYSWLRRSFDALILKSAVQRSTYHFTLKTLFRCERHCLLFGSALAAGFFLAAQSVGEALADPRSGYDPRLLSASLIVAYATIVSLRALFDLPSDRDANWIFRANIDRYRHEGREVAIKTALSLVAAGLVIAFPLHAYLWGWRVAVLHSAYVLLWSAALTQVLFFRFQKIPFACSYTASKDRALAMIILGIVGYGLFAVANSRLEASLLRDPVQLMKPALFVAVALRVQI